MTDRLRRETGSTVVTAIILLALMMSSGLALAALVDGQTTESRKERQRESALSLNEGVLYAQGFVLARNWPGKSVPSSRYFPATCTSATASATLCPTPATLALANGGSAGSSNFSSSDYQTSTAPAPTTWTTRVRDNGGTMAQFYRPADRDAAQPTCPATPCTLDWNNDRKLWVEVSAQVRGRPRSVVALLQLEEFKEALARNAITAGSVDITNNGNKGGRALVDVTGSQIAVRCTPPANDAPSGNSCVSYAKETQITPRTFVPATSSSSLSRSAIQRLRDVAEANGKLFTSCPPNNANLAGDVVFVENCASANFSGSLQTVPCPNGYPDLSRNGGCVNTPASPGLLIWDGGTLEFRGNDTFVGLVYATNSQNSSGTVLEIGGGFQVYGAVAVDGPGKLSIGSNADPNVRYDPNAFIPLRSFGTAGLVQNTWRELPPGS